MLALAAGGLAGTGATIDGLRKAEHQQMVAAQADAATGIEQARALDRQRLSAAAQAWIDEQVTEATTKLDEAISTAEGVLADTKGKVANDQVRARLTDAIDKAKKQSTIPGIESAASQVADATEKVTDSHEAWKKSEAERKAAQKAEAERREREAAAAAAGQAPSSSPSAPQRSKPTGTGATSAPAKSGQSSVPAQAKPKAAPASAGGGYKSKVAGILSRYGCGGAGISIDDPRMGRGANGTADWENNAVLIRSGLTSRLTYVVAHECVHLKQYRIYGGDINALERDMNAIYGGTGYSGLEQNADCVTRRWGISQYNYTASCGGARGKAAAAIAAGHKP